MFLFWTVGGNCNLLALRQQHHKVTISAPCYQYTDTIMESGRGYAHTYSNFMLFLVQVRLCVFRCKF